MPIAKIPLPLDSLIRARVNRSSGQLLFAATPPASHSSKQVNWELRAERERMLRLAIATTLLAATATFSAKPTSTGIGERSRTENSREEYYEKAKRESEENRPGDEGGLYPYQESSADELAAAVGHRDVGYQNTGNSVNEQPRQSIGDGWRDAVPGTPGRDYPNLDRIPVTSFTCVDKEPGGYYADAETGCQVFHVCNTGGVKSSFLCPPGSIFNQKYFVCDWWYGVNCEEAVNIFFKKSKQQLEYPSEERTYEKSENSTKLEENFEIHEGFDPLPGKYLEEKKIRNDNPSNDLFSANSGRGTVEYSSRENSRMDQQPPKSDPSNAKVSAVSINPKKPENISNNVNAPRGFSRKENESLKIRKLDRTINSQDVPNDLANYVNYGYFEAGFNNNNKDNNDKNSRDRSFDGTELKESFRNDTRLGDKYGYGEKTRSGYSSSYDPYESSESIEEDE